MRVVRCVLLPFFASRLLCILFVYYGHYQRPYLEPVPGGWEGVANWWLNPWTTYDSFWYLQIAAEGYQQHTTAFFPLYPWLLSLLGEDPVVMAASGIVLSHLALLVALYLVYKLTIVEWGHEHAQVAVWFLAFSPAAPFFGAVYTESLFMAILAATFLAVRNQRWLLAGFLGAVAAMVRNPGFLIAGSLLLEAWARRQDDQSNSKWLCWLLPLVAFISVQAGFWMMFGDPFAGVTSQEYFHRQPSWPWVPLFSDLYTLVSADYVLIYFLVPTAGLFFTLAGLLCPLLYRLNIRPSYILLIFAITLMNLIYARQLAPHTITATRYLGALFPVAQIAALMFVNTSSTKLKMLMFGLFALNLIFFSYLFGLKIFIG